MTWHSFPQVPLLLHIIYIVNCNLNHSNRTFHGMAQLPFYYLMKSIRLTFLWHANFILMIRFGINLTNTILGDVHHSGLILSTTMLYPSDLYLVDVCSWAEDCLFWYWIKVLYMLIVTIRQGTVAVVVYMPSGNWARNTLQVLFISFVMH